MGAPVLLVVALLLPFPVPGPAVAVAPAEAALPPGSAQPPEDLSGVGVRLRWGDEVVPASPPPAEAPPTSRSADGVDSPTATSAALAEPRWTEGVPFSDLAPGDQDEVPQMVAHELIVHLPTPEIAWLPAAIPPARAAPRAAAAESSSSGTSPSAGPAASPSPPGTPPALEPVHVPRAADRPLGFLRVVSDILRALFELLLRGGAPLVVLYHRVLGPSLLDHPTRRALLDAVGRAPGRHLSALARDLEAHPKTLAYHLLLLERGGHVSLVREGRQLRAYPRAAGRPAETDSTRGRLLAALRREGSATREALAAELGVSPQAVSYHAGALAREGALVARRRGRGVEYRLLARPPRRDPPASDPAPQG